MHSGQHAAAYKLHLLEAAFVDRRTYIDCVDVQDPLRVWNEAEVNDMC